VKISLDAPITYLITSGEATDADFDAAKSRIIETVAAAAEAGASLIQIREKNLSARSLFELTSEVVAATREFDIRVLVNDRADIAFAAEADGVHLTANSLPATVIRENFPREFVIGVSTHTVDEAVDAANSGADFAVFGPVFETPGKTESKGIDALREACTRVAPFPVLAIGGVDADNVRDIINAGASGVAAIRALNDADSMRRLLAKLK
jgi:thiamine-phosphate pyrophosphorylase